MRFAALYQAAIDILDQYLNGSNLEVSIKLWGKKNRYAGSSDRRRIRDITFDIIRQKNSCAYIGGGFTGRQLIMGYLLLRGSDLDAVFNGSKFAPKKITNTERDCFITSYEKIEIYELDYPSWFLPLLKSSLSENFNDYLSVMRYRAMRQLRINKKKTSRDEVIAALNSKKILVEPNNLVSSGINVLENAHKIMQSDLFLGGLIEFQDVGSQLISHLIKIKEGDHVLDLCAGSGGKTLAVASEANKSASYFAWDENFKRMNDLELRAKRAGVKIVKLSDKPVHAIYDIVIIDAPCSGSGSWRRNPQDKWELNLESLNANIKIQRKLIQDGLNLVKSDGEIIYITCSVLKHENETLLNDLMVKNNTFYIREKLSLLPSLQNDGFFGAVLKKINK